VCLGTLRDCFADYHNVAKLALTDCKRGNVTTKWRATPSSGTFGKHFQKLAPKRRDLLLPVSRLIPFIVDWNHFDIVEKNIYIMFA
jgi:hypothetical protein